jgi:hypothetical protein
MQVILFYMLTAKHPFWVPLHIHPAHNLFQVVTAISNSQQFCEAKIQVVYRTEFAVKGIHVAACRVRKMRGH